MKIPLKRQKILCPDCGEVMRPCQICDLLECPRCVALGRIKQPEHQKTELAQF
jgi:phage FluMu protein Com